MLLCLLKDSLKRTHLEDVNDMPSVEPLGTDRLLCCQGQSEYTGIRRVHTGLLEVSNVPSSSRVGNVLETR